MFLIVMCKVVTGVKTVGNGNRLRLAFPSASRSLEGGFQALESRARDLRTIV